MSSRQQAGCKAHPWASLQQMLKAAQVAEAPPKHRRHRPILSGRHRKNSVCIRLAEPVGACSVVVLCCNTCMSQLRSPDSSYEEIIDDMIMCASSKQDAWAAWRCTTCTLCFRCGTVWESMLFGLQACLAAPDIRLVGAGAILHSRALWRTLMEQCTSCMPTVSSAPGCFELSAISRRCAAASPSVARQTVTRAPTASTAAADPAAGPLRPRSPTDAPGSDNFHTAGQIVCTIA